MASQTHSRCPASPSLECRVRRVRHEGASPSRYAPHCLRLPRSSGLLITPPNSDGATRLLTQIPALEPLRRGLMISGSFMPANGRILGLAGGDKEFSAPTESASDGCPPSEMLSQAPGGVHCPSIGWRSEGGVVASHCTTHPLKSRCERLNEQCAWWLHRRPSNRPAIHGRKARA